MVEEFKRAGTVRVLESARNPQVPDSPLALARLDVTLSTPDLIVSSDDGLWPQIRSGLSVSFKALSWSLAFVIIGVLSLFTSVVLNALHGLRSEFRSMRH